MATPNRFQSGFRLEDGNALNVALATPQWQTNHGITALAGGGLHTNTPILTLGSNTITVVGSANDSVVLPKAVAGSVVFLRNADAAEAVQVFGNGSNTINGTAGATGISVAAGKSVMFVAVSDGVWFSLLSA